MSIGSIVAGGIGFVRTQPRLVAIWSVLYLVIATLGMLAMRPFLISLIAFQQETAARAAAGVKTPPLMPPGMIGTLFVVEIVAAVLGLVAFAAVVRATARPGGDRFAYLRLGMDELRLLGLGVLLVIAAFVAEIVAILVIILLGVAAKAVVGDAAAVVVAVVAGIALVCAAIWVEVRLSLAGALTVLRGRIVIGPAWRATQGQFWTLFGVFFLFGIAWMAAGIVLIAISNPGLISAYASMDRVAVAQAAQAQMAYQAAGLSAGLVVQMMVGAIVMVVMGTVLVASLATAAIELEEREVRESESVEVA